MNIEKLTTHMMITMVFINDWFISDPGLQDWRKRGELRDMIDKWNDICDGLTDDEVIRINEMYLDKLNTMKKELEESNA